MNKPKRQEHKPLSSVTGTMTCQRGHGYSVRDLNLERKSDGCPVCGGYTSIKEGFTQNDGPKR